MGDLNAWDVSRVTDMYFTFYELNFNGNIAAWDVGSVTTMEYMFTKSKISADISAWDTAAVTTMSQMFKGAKAFNSDLSSWDTKQVKVMSEMFDGSGISKRVIAAISKAWKITASSDTTENINEWAAVTTAYPSPSPSPTPTPPVVLGAGNRGSVAAAATLISMAAILASIV